MVGYVGWFSENVCLSIFWVGFFLQLEASTSAFAALRSDGVVVSWGAADCGGDCRVMAVICGFVKAWLGVVIWELLLMVEEICRSPVDMVNISLVTGFYTSQVVQDFFHQQYLYIG